MVKRTLPGSPDTAAGVAVSAILALTGAPMAESPRPSSKETENENQRAPARDGEAPRPATEPAGSEGSSNPGDTATDPATGKPNP